MKITFVGLKFVLFGFVSSNFETILPQFMNMSLVCKFLIAALSWGFRDWIEDELIVLNTSNIGLFLHKCKKMLFNKSTVVPMNQMDSHSFSPYEIMCSSSSGNLHIFILSSGSFKHKCLPQPIHLPSNEARKKSPSLPWLPSLPGHLAVTHWLGLGLGTLAHHASPQRSQLLTLTCLIPSSTFLSRNGSQANNFTGSFRSRCNLFLLSARYYVLPFTSKQCQLLAQGQSLQFTTCPNTQWFQNPCRWTFQHYSISVLWAAFHQWLCYHSFSVTHSRLTTWASVLKPQILHLFLSLSGNDHGSHFWKNSTDSLSTICPLISNCIHIISLPICYHRRTAYTLI